MKKLLLGIVVIASSLLAASAQVILTDTVDSGTKNYTGFSNGSGGGWNIITNGTFTSSYGGLVPTAGSTFFDGASSSSGNSGLSVYYSGTPIAAGTYTISFDVGSFTTGTFYTPNVYLLADTGNNGYSYGDRIVTTADSANLAPAAGNWSHVSYTVTIADTTLTAGGAAALGQTLGVMFLYSLPTGGGQFAVDNLTISFTPAAVPEPSTTAAFGLGALLLGAGVAFRRLRARA